MKNSMKLILTLICVCYTGVLSAGIDEFNLPPGNQVPAGFTPNSSISYTVNPTLSTDYTYNSFNNYVYLKYEHDLSTILPESFDVEVDISISVRYEGIDPSDPLVPLPDVTLSLHIDPSSGAIENDFHAYKFTGVELISFTIDDARVSNSASGLVWNDVKSHFKMDAGIIVDRYIPLDLYDNWDFTGLYQIINTTSPTDKFELTFDWPYFTGAEEYQLEWLWIDDDIKSGTESFMTDNDLSGVIDILDIPVNFKRGASRVTTSLTQFTIPRVFPSGYIVWRVRPMGYVNGVDYMVPGKWTTDDLMANLLSHFYSTPDLQSFVFQLSNGHEENLNWEYNLVLAEDGKHKMALNYYDGSLRPRQSVTRQQNAAGTNVVVNEAILDHLGREAITTMPAPVNSLSLEYYPDFNLNLLGQPYSFSDFAVPSTGCIPEGAPMKNSSGAAKYYSPNNDFTNDIHHNLIPDANGYPYAQTVFDNDHLGRVIRQGGLGFDHRIGSGHETIYAYSRPEQETIDALFGNNAGDATFYEKTRVVDANGQTTISIKDLRGNVVASYMIGEEASNNLGTLPGQTTEVRTHPVKNYNATDEGLDGLYMSTTVDVGKSQTYTFDYSFDPSVFVDACPDEDPAVNLCFECVYDMTITLRDECNNTVWTSSQLLTIGTENDQCNGTPLGTQTLTKQLFLEQGRYVLDKSLTLNQNTMQNYLQSYYEQKICLEDFEDFLDPAKVVTCDGEEILDCNECEKILATMDDQTADYTHMEAFCAKLCEPEMFCNTAYQQMLRDVTPGGQYARYTMVEEPDQYGYLRRTYSTDVNVHSVLNTQSNILPHQVLMVNGSKETFQNLHYQNPINLDPTKDAYLNFDGTPSIVTTKRGAELKPEYLSLGEFIENWKPSWAHTLVKFHPEYNYYVWCSEIYTDESKDYKREMLGESEYTVANNRGWLDPLKLSTVPAGITSSNDPNTVEPHQDDEDPFFNDANLGAYPLTQGSSFSYRTTVSSRFNNYLPYKDNTGAQKYLNLWEFAVMATADLTIDEADGYDFSSANCDFDKFWIIFRSLYLDMRDEIARSSQNRYAFQMQSCNSCIGVDPEAAWVQQYSSISASSRKHPDNYPTYGQATKPYKVYNDPAQPCYRNTPYKNKERRFPTKNFMAQKSGIDLHLKDEQLLRQVLGRSAEELEAHYTTSCEANVEVWMQKLAKCDQFFTAASIASSEKWEPDYTTYDDIRNDILDICMASCGPDNPNGGISAGNKSVNDVLQQYLDFSSCAPATMCAECNELLLEAPYEGEMSYFRQVFATEVIDPCGCNKVFSANQELENRLAVEPESSLTLGDVFYELYGALPNDDIDNVKCKCDEAYALTGNTCWDETAAWNHAAEQLLQKSGFNVHPGLNCGECISCNIFNQGYYDFVAEYGNVEDHVNFESLVARNWNAAFGMAWTYEDYEPYLDLCGTITPLVEGRDAHIGNNCETLSAYGEEMKKLTEVVFGNLSSFAFKSVLIDLTATPGPPLFGLTPADFDDILPTGCDDIKIELHQVGSLNEVNIKLWGYYQDPVTSTYSWVLFASLYLEAEKIEPHDASLNHLANLDAYTSTFSGLTFTPSFLYKNGSLTSNRFQVEANFTSATSISETITLKGRNVYYHTSSCNTTPVIQDPLVDEDQNTLTVFQDVNMEVEDCFCDNISDAFSAWNTPSIQGTFADFLALEHNPPIPNLADAIKMKDYIDWKCCHETFNLKYANAVVGGGNECPPLSDAFKYAPPTTNGVYAINSHGPTYDIIWGQLQVFYKDCPDGTGHGPGYPCEFITEELEEVLNGYSNYSSTQVNELLTKLIGTNVRMIGGSKALEHVEPCVDCPRPDRMLCAESYEKPDYIAFLNALLTKDHTDQVPVYRKNMPSQTEVNTFLTPHFNIFTSKLNRSKQDNGTLVKYELVSESTTELKLRVTYDHGRPTESIDNITLSTCCTTINFNDIVNVVDLEPAEVNNQLMFYLKVDMGTCGIIRLKGTSSLFTLSSCCEINTDICYDREIEIVPCEEGPNLDGLAEAAKLYGEYRQQISDDFERAYKMQCFAHQDQLSYTYTDFSHTYTLYYYDQAGNLVETVPPAGVRRLTQPQIDAVQDFRDGTIGTETFPEHELITYYKYNATGQLVEQETPDGGVSTFYYDDLGRLVASQNAKQAATLNNQYSYTEYDNLGRIVEVGQKSGTTALTDDMAATPAIEASPTLAEWYASGTREQASYTQYSAPKHFTANNELDNLDIANAFGADGQQNLINRVAMTYYSETADPEVRDFASHYSYDLAGNVNVLVQEIGELKAYDNQFKKMEYEYDLVSGNTNKVYYQKGASDQMIHFYEYDAENRLISTKTSTDGVFWDQDETYQYYLHGPLARKTTGHNQVQGTDYAHTLQGWLKSVNSDFLQAEYDPGQDGFEDLSVLPPPPFPNKHVARDAVGFSLGYYTNDYVGIGSSGHLSTGNGALANDMFNGNINHMVTALQPFVKAAPSSPMYQAFSYDQLNRISVAESFEDMNASTRAWASPAMNRAYETNYAYDANGNISSLKRWGYIGSTSQLMDDLHYDYTAGTNQLYEVEDQQTNDALFDSDFDGTATYTYDEVGNLVSDPNEEIASTQWTVYGKVKSVNRTTASSKADLAFEYDASGNRVIKRVLPDVNYQHKYEYQVRDAAGNTMAVYSLSAKKDFAEDFLNYADINAEIITQHSLPGFSTFIQNEFSTDAVFKAALMAELLANDNAQDLYAAYTPNELFAISNTFYEDMLEAYPTHDLATYFLAQNQTQTIDDLYQCDPVAFIEALLLHDAPSFIAQLDLTNPAITNALCLQHFGGACPNGPVIDLATVNTTILASDINSHPAIDVKAAIANLGNAIIANAVANQTSTHWFTDNIQSCGAASTYQGYLNNDAITAKSHLMSALGYSTILQRLMDNDINGFLNEVVNLATGYNFIAEAQENTNTLTIPSYQAMIDGTYSWGNIEAGMQAAVTDFDLTLTLNERQLYGSSRIGTLKEKVVMWTRGFDGGFTNGLHQYTVNTDHGLAKTLVDPANYKNKRGAKLYELANHLGNVLATITDRKLAVDENTDGVLDYYEADVIGAQYYYPFGMQMPERTHSVVQDEITAEVTAIVEQETVVTDHDFTSSLDGWFGYHGATVVIDNGRMKITSDDLNEPARYYYATIPGQRYKLTVDIEWGTAEDIKIRIDSQDPQYMVLNKNYVPEGISEFEFTAASSSARITVRRFDLPAQNTFDFYVKHITLSEIHEVSSGNALVMELDKPSGYKYGFNGQEKDDEIYGSGNSMSAQYWQYDSRLGRRWNVDPVYRSYQSSYVPFSNNPIVFADPNGNLEIVDPSGLSEGELANHKNRIDENHEDYDPEYAKVIGELDADPKTIYELNYSKKSKIKTPDGSKAKGYVGYEGTKTDDSGTERDVVSINYTQNNGLFTSNTTLYEEVYHANQFRLGEWGFAQNDDGTWGTIGLDLIDEGEAKYWAIINADGGAYSQGKYYMKKISEFMDEGKNLYTNPQKQMDHVYSEIMSIVMYPPGYKKGLSYIQDLETSSYEKLYISRINAEDAALIRIRTRDIEFTIDGMYDCHGSQILLNDHVWRKPN